MNDDDRKMILSLAGNIGEFISAFRIVLDALKEQPGFDRKKFEDDILKGVGACEHSSVKNLVLIISDQTAVP